MRITAVRSQGHDPKLVAAVTISSIIVIVSPLPLIASPLPLIALSLPPLETLLL